MVHNNPEALWVTWIRPFYNFCTATFFALSGYLTLIPLKDTEAFYKKRILRTIIPYLIWSAIWGLLFIFKHEFDVVSFIKKLVTFRTCGIYYFFAVYVQFVLLTPLLGKLLQSKCWKLGFLVTPLSYIPIYALVIAYNPLKFPWNAICCVVWLTFYYLGLCVRNGRININVADSKKWVLGFIVISILQAAEGSYWYFYGDFDMATTQFKYTALIGTYINIVLLLMYVQNGVSIFHWRGIGTNRFATMLTGMLKKTGDYAFGIYLSHRVVMTFLNKVLYSHVSKIFPLDVILLLIVEMVGMEVCKKIFGKWPKFCRWVGLS